MHLLIPQPLILNKNFPFVAVAEWSKASDHFRSFGHKLKWGSGGQIFFPKKKRIDLRSILVFTPFFKLYVTFLLMCMAIFPKMAPLFSYEPTVC